MRGGGEHEYEYEDEDEHEYEEKDGGGGDDEGEVSRHTIIGPWPRGAGSGAAVSRHGTDL